MPSASLLSKRTVGCWGLRLCVVPALLLACQEQAAPDRSAPPQPPAPASVEQTRVRRPAPSGEFGCQELRPPPETERAAGAETIELLPPGTGKTVFVSKTGVVMTFNREEFLKAARCLKLEKAVRYVEQETGHAPETALMDAFQLSYVVAALLDAGRASVRVQDETEHRKSIVRDAWAADGCSGRCRSFGRLYRLSTDDSSFFLRITDKTRNDWD